MFWIPSWSDFTTVGVPALLHPSVPNCQKRILVFIVTSFKKV